MKFASPPASPSNQRSRKDDAPLHSSWQEAANDDVAYGGDDENISRVLTSRPDVTNVSAELQFVHIEELSAQGVRCLRFLVYLVIIFAFVFGAVTLEKQGRHG